MSAVGNLYLISITMIIIPTYQENIAVHVADNKIDKLLLQEIITSILYENDYDEELQLKIVNAIFVEKNDMEETEF